jgi:hypothetical protein
MKGVLTMYDKMKEILALENKYGLLIFRMGLTHVMDIGLRNLAGDEVEGCVKQIMAQGEDDKTKGRISIMTPEFQCDIVRCAAELTRFSAWNLFAYIKEHVVIGCDAKKYLLLNCCERKIGVPELYDSLDKAQSAMKSALIESMDGFDDNIFDEYEKGKEYALGADKAWFSDRYGNNDWLILVQTNAGKIQSI